MSHDINFLCCFVCKSFLCQLVLISALDLLKKLHAEKNNVSQRISRAKFITTDCDANFLLKIRVIIALDVELKSFSRFVFGSRVESSMRLF